MLVGGGSTNIWKIPYVSSFLFLKASLIMSQEIHSEKDEDARCTNYPNENCKDYNECDETNVHDRVKLYYNITPVWATRDLDSVTKHRKFLQV